MNINHVEDKDIDIPKSNLLQAIFDHQEKLHKKYLPVEEKNGIGFAVVKDRPFSFDDRFWQYMLKDMSWRVVEELTEATEAHLDGNYEHYVEELIDALHFYTELMIVIDLGAKDVLYSYKDTTQLMVSMSREDVTPYSVIMLLGLSCNLLKNKPWKNTHLVTDVVRFRLNIVNGYRNLLRLICRSGIINAEELYLIYAKKNTVNRFRIRSNY